MPRRTYDFEGRWECTRGTSNKFYEIHYVENTRGYAEFHCSWGPIGRAPSTIRYDNIDVMKKVRAFNRKGYVQVGQGVRPTIKTVEATPVFEPTNTKARLSQVDETEQAVTNKPKAKKKVAAVVTGRLASIDDED